ncbi:MFS transporter [Agromyces intestinalis]|uniref:MFS transporter n=1 Tax=Agromyces intestinalis TaxID=2592652 RepID=A0A5C1YD55_9MICO|nr:MFS transporter [Agromyces intestinalis]QEO13966.1 MFS transporter [Agromyces intestinalis]
MSAHGASGSILKQPKAVWAVAFASVISFMGIGLVDPILPAIAESLQATPTETEMLFTAYLAVTGVAMLFTSWVSSRIGVKKTLLVGLVLIVVFAAAAGLSNNVEAIIGFRAGWGLGNAFFISTALATIVDSAKGGRAAAIILYEAALGLGIAAGPLIGAALGNISWRGPFFGTASLMAVAFIAIVAFLPKTDDSKLEPTRLSAPFKALAQPTLLALALAALFYNIGFFVLLAYSPFVLGFDVWGLGLTFFGWGLALAITSVFLAPVLTARMRRSRVLWIALPLLAVVLVLCGVFWNDPTMLVVLIVAGGLVLGVLNTVLTECVMGATDLPRVVASGAYSAVRFIGGAIAPPAATEIAREFGADAPYFAAAVSVAIAAVIVIACAKPLARADVDEEELDDVDEAEAVLLGDAA